MKNIMVVTDGSEGCARALDQGADLARAFAAKLWLVSTTPAAGHKWGPDYIGNEEDSDRPRREEAEALHEKHQQLQRVARELREKGLEATALLIEGPLPEKTLREAERLAADLIVIGGRCYGSIFHRLVGSGSDWVVENARRPVLIVPDEPA